ncbi:MAG TPA: group 1 glycosyl transferase, partial [Chitinophagaceae bacterium]|nr:group 1 glycosyl transferase [Chitinophagaceae bacterium]
DVLIPAMQMVNAVLHIYGDGNFVPQLNKLIAVYNVESKVKFFDKLLPQQLKAITHQAYIGLNLVENTGLNQYYSLANKFFDYIQALVPQVTMDFPEYRKINERYQVALLIENLTEENIATSLNRLLDDKKLYAQLQHNCSKARAELNWENEEKNLWLFYKQLFG